MHFGLRCVWVFIYSVNCCCFFPRILLWSLNVLCFYLFVLLLFSKGISHIMILFSLSSWSSLRPLHIFCCVPCFSPLGNPYRWTSYFSHFVSYYFFNSCSIFIDAVCIFAHTHRSPPTINRSIVFVVVIFFKKKYRPFMWPAHIHSRELIKKTISRAQPILPILVFDWCFVFHSIDRVIFHYCKGT